MEQLIANDIKFGAIAVLSRSTAPYVERIYQFFDKLKVHSRFLPFYLSAFDEQIAHHELEYDELVESQFRLFRAWLSSTSATFVEPIDEYVRYAVAFCALSPMKFYEKYEDEYVFAVNLDGTVCGAEEIYVNDLTYGNLLYFSFTQVLNSPGRFLSIERANARRDKYCLSCPYYGACPGDFVQNASIQQQKLLATRGCPVRGILERIVPEIAGFVPLEQERQLAPSRSIPMMV